MRVAALYIRGRIVMGRSHLDAFEHLSEEEKMTDDISSGFFDDETGEFAGYDAREHFFNKEMILVRHGSTSQDSIDPNLTSQGVDEVLKATQFIENIDLSGCVGLSSPHLRCLETAKYISHTTDVPFQVHPSLVETPPFLTPGDSYNLTNHHDKFPEFVWNEETNWEISYESQDTLCGRIIQLLKELPKKCIIVTHHGIVKTILKLALCTEKAIKIPPASVTYIENREVKYLGK